MIDYAHNERKAYLRESAHRHLRIVRLWRRLTSPEVRAEAFAWLIVGLVLGEALGRLYGR